ncbi:FxLYD domain-containing protein [Rubneribacter sp.]
MQQDRGFSGQPAPLSALAVTSLVLGVVAFLVSFIPLLNSFSVVAGLLGVIFGIVGIAVSAKGARRGRGLAIAGLVVCVVSILVSFASCGALVDAVDENANPVTTEDGSAASNSPAADEGAAQQDAEKYAVADEQLVDKGYGMYAITGTLTNTSGKDFGYVQVQYVLKDASGAQIGTAWGNTSSLADGVSWKFEAIASVNGDEPPASFELADVTGF